MDGTFPNYRAEKLFPMLEPLVPYLPASVSFTMTAHDIGALLPGEDQKAFLKEKIAMGEYATREELKPLEWNHRHEAIGVRGFVVSGFKTACLGQRSHPAYCRALVSRTVPHGKRPSPTTRLVHPPKQRELSSRLPMQTVSVASMAVVSLTPDPNLIHDHKATFNFCNHPEWLKFHGQLGGDAKPAVFRPMFQSSKLYGNGEIVTTPLDFVNNATGSVSWDDKTIAKLHWRGKTTGDFYSNKNDANWRNSHRIRLHKLTHADTGTRDIYVKSRRTGSWEMQTWEADKVNKAYMDVGLVDKTIQVSCWTLRKLMPVFQGGWNL